MNDKLYARLSQMRLDRYAVDQGLMLNCLVGALTGIVGYPDENGKVKSEDIADAVERALLFARKID